MLSDVSYANAIPHAANMKEAIATYHPFQNYESLASLHGVVAFRFKHADETAENFVDMIISGGRRVSPTDLMFRFSVLVFSPCATWFILRT